MSLLCKIVGHKWHRRFSDHVYKHGELFEQKWIRHEPCCMRCGVSNPRFVTVQVKPQLKVVGGRK